jgi:hypothetical protein
MGLMYSELMVIQIDAWDTLIKVSMVSKNHSWKSVVDPDAEVRSSRTAQCCIVPFTRPDLKIRICSFWKWYGVGDRIHGSVPSRGKGFACSANQTDFGALYGVLCLWALIGQGMKLLNHTHLVLRLRMGGAITLLPLYNLLSCTEAAYLQNTFCGYNIK